MRSTSEPPRRPTSRSCRTEGDQGSVETIQIHFIVIGSLLLSFAPLTTQFSRWVGRENEENGDALRGCRGCLQKHRGSENRIAAPVSFRLRVDFCPVLLDECEHAFFDV